MSKISEYQAALKKLAEDGERQSLGDFAKDLGKTSEALLLQLAEAGITKTAATDVITSSDKSKLLKWLQAQHSDGKPRKKITVTHDPLEHRLIRAVAEQKNGAEYEALEYLLGAVLRGDKLPPPMQELTNVIVAKCLFFGALPLRKIGRPKREELDSVGLDAAERYWGLVDSGVSYQEAVGIVSSEIHKSERHVMRLIAKHKERVGDTPEKRDTYRAIGDFQRKYFAESSSYLDACSKYARAYDPPIPPPDLNTDDYLEHLEELIERIASNAQPLTKKI